MGESVQGSIVDLAHQHFNLVFARGSRDQRSVDDLTIHRHPAYPAGDVLRVGHLDVVGRIPEDARHFKPVPCGWDAGVHAQPVVFGLDAKQVMRAGLVHP